MSILSIPLILGGGKREILAGENMDREGEADRICKLTARWLSW